MFKNRKDAAIQLGKALEKYKGINALVLGIPRGGAETAYYVARELEGDMGLVISRKLGHPQNPEYAIGAIAEDGSIYLSPYASSEVSEEELAQIKKEQEEEIKSRIQRFRNGKPLPEMKGRTVILVDDGIATGATLMATIMLCKNNEAQKIVVGAPVSSREMAKKLKTLVDDVIILEIPYDYHAVSQVYEEFFNLRDEDAIQFLKDWEKSKKENQNK
ncbi:phosphoribosyltransferase [Cecembia calidifontis]|jgi:predicted phosphoribosyltransferase|uniref:Putative phosphoribosyltransferase n=1 Tax=Cecembia calidifontis TaxID=1187080 RepID=A0A4Q7PBK6_9BACT|nr:phosphoribosyltransferase family protein [Cecembia calidifontis]RZS97644.1 putative phosphoribosyltransferase [Cecembia calidifontis]